MASRIIEAHGWRSVQLAGCERGLIWVINPPSLKARKRASGSVCGGVNWLFSRRCWTLFLYQPKDTEGCHFGTELGVEGETM